jgi:RNA polymerase sigma-70 factor (ECF subfamily)
VEGRGDTRAAGSGSDPGARIPAAGLADDLAALRPDVHAHCYRMLGSLEEAEDAVQETLLRAWRARAGFEERSSPRTWLWRIATNVCIDARARRSRRALPIDLGPASVQAVPDGEARLDLPWLDPYPDRLLSAGSGRPEVTYQLKESVELAYIAALQRLPPRQRAALLLHEVLELPAVEIAEVLDTTVASVTSALQRARAELRRRRPEISHQETARRLGDEVLRRQVTAFSEALRSGDVDAVLALLTSDATWSMPPRTEWYQGHAAIADFLTRMAFQVSWEYVLTSASGQPAVAFYARAGTAAAYRPYALNVVSFRGQLISDVTAFIDASLFRRFGLPGRLPDRRAQREIRPDRVRRR